MSQVERLLFTDRYVALDADGSGHAGQSAQIVRAFFGTNSLNSPEILGIGIRLLDDGIPYGAVVSMAVDALRVGGALRTNADFVQIVYRNVVGQAPSLQEFGAFVGLLDSGQFSQAQLGIIAATAPVNAESVELVGLATTGIDYIPFNG